MQDPFNIHFQQWNIILLCFSASIEDVRVVGVVYNKDIPEEETDNSF